MKHTRSSVSILAFVLVAGCLRSHATAIDTNPVDLFLIAGQSNAVGFDAKPSELPADPRDKDVMFWFRTGDPPPDEFDTRSAGWTTLGPQPRGTPNPDKKAPRQYGNFRDPDGGFGPEIGLARTLLTQQPGRRIAIVKAAFSGTALPMDWDPSPDSKSGLCYQALVTETKTAIAAAKAKGITLNIRAMCWVQGESDANATAAPLYADRLTKMIASLRHDLDAPDLIALLAVNTHFGGGKNPFMPKIVDAQREVAAHVPRTAYVDTADCAIANNVHFSGIGTLDVGRRFADALSHFK